MNLVKVTIKEQYVLVNVPPTPGFDEAAREAGGACIGFLNTWAFPPQDADMVKDLLRQYYGTDGTDTFEGVVRIPLEEFSGQKDVVLCGYVIVRRPAVPSGTALGEGVRLLEGDITFTPENTIGDLHGVVVELSGVPLAVARVIQARTPGATVITSDAVRDTLSAVRDTLTEKIAEINRALGE